MHTLRTFILKILVASEKPGLLQGFIQAVEEESPHRFHGEEALLALLRRMSQGQPAEEIPAPAEKFLDSENEVMP